MTWVEVSDTLEEPWYVVNNPISVVGSRNGWKFGTSSGTTFIPLTAVPPSFGTHGTYDLSGSISSIAEGDLVVAVYATPSTSPRTLSITDGTNPYTLIDSQLYSKSSLGVNLRVAYKFMGSVPDTGTYFGATQSTAEAGSMAVYVFRDVDTTNPLDVPVVTSSVTANPRPNPPSITPVNIGSLCLFIGANAHTDNFATFASADLDGFITRAGSDTRDVTIGIGYKNGWTSGAVNPGAFTFTGLFSEQYPSVAMSIAFRSLNRVGVGSATWVESTDQSQESWN
jgi:hypothetical protein